MTGESGSFYEQAVMTGNPAISQKFSIWEQSIKCMDISDGTN